MYKMLLHGFILFASITCLSTLTRAFANGGKCDEAVRNADLFVRNIKAECEALKQCLVRRDTCVSDGIPKTEAKCEEVNACMGARDRDFGDFAQCPYEWSKLSDQFECRVQNKMLAGQDRCPGRILGGIGLLGMVLRKEDFIRVAVDSEFNCGAVNLYFKYKTKNFDSIRQKVIDYCDQGRERVKAFVAPECTEAREFKAKPDGQFALPAGVSLGKHINESRDESGSGNDGGGEESGGGGGPKTKKR